MKGISAIALALLLIGCDSNANSVDATNDATVTQSTSDSESEAKIVADIKQVIIEQVGDVAIDKVQLSPLDGFYEVIMQGQVVYVSSDRKFLFPGPLLSVEGQQLTNLTQNALREVDLEKNPVRKEIIDAVSLDEMVVFKAENEKHVISVFTDVDCAYCRKLHQNMDGYLSRGISVHYLAFPRAGIGSGSYNKLVSVWCAEDQQAAMDTAKLTGNIEPKDCDNPIADQYQMTRQMSLTGTPAIVLSDGELVAGFIEPEKLADYLDQKAPSDS